MHRNRLKKIFGVGPLGALISLALLAVAAGIAHYAGLGAVTRYTGIGRLVGWLLILLGLGLHIWSFLTLRSWWVEDQLCTQGPFRLVRHPMYAAWISMVAPGAVLILNRWIYVVWLAAVHILFHRLVLREEEAMGRLFGDTYRTYASQTGRFLPRFISRSSG